jgi:transposase
MKFEVEHAFEADPMALTAVWLGIDWADKNHRWAMQVAGANTRIEQGELEHTPEALEQFAVALAARFPGQNIAVALEQSRGALWFALSKYAHIILFPVHPNTLDHYRKSFYPSGAKSDPVDGDLIVEYLVRHPERLRPLALDTVATRTLQFLTEERRKLVDQNTGETQRLTQWLKIVFPQLLAWFDSPHSALVGDLLLRWPTLEALQKAAPKTLRKFLERHNCRGEERLHKLLEQIRTALPATRDAALLAAGQASCQTSVRVLEVRRTAIAQLDRAIAEALVAHPDYAIVASLPGAGPALEPRLIAALGTCRERFGSAQALACAVGIAPVTKASGQSREVHWRWSCPKFVRQTFQEWAGCSIPRCAWAREHYRKQRAKGQEHHAAVRSLAFKWIRILFRCWRDRVPYSEAAYTAALEKAPRVTPPPSREALLAGVEWKSCGGLKKLVCKSPELFA